MRTPVCSVSISPSSHHLKQFFTFLVFMSIFRLDYSLQIQVTRRNRSFHKKNLKWKVSKGVEIFNKSLIFYYSRSSCTLSPDTFCTSKKRRKALQKTSLDLYRPGGFSSRDIKQHGVCLIS